MRTGIRLIACTMICGPLACTMLSGGSVPPLSVAAPDSLLIGEGTAATVVAVAAGGTAPYVYRWSVESGPATVTLEDPVTQTLTTPVLDVQGTYVLRVVATDSLGLTALDYGKVVVGPPDIVPGEFNVVIQGPDEPINFGQTASLTSFSSRESVTYLWEVVGGDGVLDSLTNSSTILQANGVGNIVVKLTATDPATEETATDEFTVQAQPIVTAAADAIALIGEAEPLTAVIDPDDAPVTILWEIIEGSGEVQNDATTDASLVAAAPETVVVRVTVTADAESETPVAVTAEVKLAAVADLTPRVLYQTTEGDFVMELDAAAAPITTANMLFLVDMGFYDGVLIHRVAKQQAFGGGTEPFVIQGGGFVRTEDDELDSKDRPFDPIPSEAGNGLSNGTLYSVAMALAGGDVNSATTEWFINTSTSNAYLDGQNFTVFGIVVDGIATIEQIIGVDVEVSPILGGEISLPVPDLVMNAVTRVNETQPGDGGTGDGGTVDGGTGDAGTGDAGSGDTGGEAPPVDDEPLPDEGGTADAGQSEPAPLAMWIACGAVPCCRMRRSNKARRAL